LPTPVPVKDVPLDAVAEPLVSEAYVYLLRVVVLFPIAKMPRVLLPAAEEYIEATLDEAAVPFVSQANVYLLRVTDAEQETLPSANMPTVPAARPDLTLHPQLLAEVAPNAIGDGIALNSLKLG
jgi:hypothetical protein